MRAIRGESRKEREGERSGGWRAEREEAPVVFFVLELFPRLFPLPPLLTHRVGISRVPALEVGCEKLVCGRFRDWFREGVRGKREFCLETCRGRGTADRKPNQLFLSYSLKSSD